MREIVVLAIVVLVLVLLLGTAGRWTLRVRRNRREEDRRSSIEEQIWWAQLRAPLPDTPASLPADPGQVPAG